MDAILNALKCTNCGKVFEKAIILPCGDSVCHRHIDQCDSIECVVCGKSYELKDQNFPPNKTAEKILSTKIDKFNFGEQYSKAMSSYNHFRSEFETARETILKRSLIPSIVRLRKEIEIKCNTIKQQLDTYSNYLFKKLNELEEKSNEIVSDLDKKNADLDAIWAELWVFDSGDTKWKLIITQCEKNVQDLQDIIDSNDALNMIEMPKDFLKLGRELDNKSQDKPDNE